MGLDIGSDTISFTPHQVETLTDTDNEDQDGKVDKEKALQRCRGLIAANCNDLIHIANSRVTNEGISLGDLLRNADENNSIPLEQSATIANSLSKVIDVVYNRGISESSVTYTSDDKNDTEYNLIISESRRINRIPQQIVGGPFYELTEEFRKLVPDSNETDIEVYKNFSELWEHLGICVNHGLLEHIFHNKDSLTPALTSHLNKYRDVLDDKDIQELVDYRDLRMRFTLLNIIACTLTGYNRSSSAISYLNERKRGEISSPVIIAEATFTTQPDRLAAKRVRSLRSRVKRLHSYYRHSPNRTISHDILNFILPSFDKKVMNELFEVALNIEKSRYLRNYIEESKPFNEYKHKEKRDSLLRLARIPKQTFDYALQELIDHGLRTETADALIISRDVYYFARNLSSYLYVMNRYIPIQSRPDAVRFSGEILPKKALYRENRPIRARDPYFQNIASELRSLDIHGFTAFLESGSYKILLDDLRASYRTFTRDYESNPQEAATSLLLIKESAEFLREIYNKYREGLKIQREIFVDEISKAKMELIEYKPTSFVYQNPTFEKDMDRRMLILVLNLFAELRKPEQDFYKWLTAEDSDMMWIMGLGIFDVKYFLVKLFGTPNGYKNAEQLIKHPKRDLLAPGVRCHTITSRLPYILREYINLADELKSDIAAFTAV